MANSPWANQNLVTIFGSCQPIYLKYICIGDSANIFFLINLLERICSREDRIITTNIPPIMATAKILPVKSPTTAKVAPKAKDPASPKKILAGQILKYKKANKLPIHIPINDASVKSKDAEAMAKKANKHISSSPADRPSNPSEIL